ncbi:MAG: hypothetical protein ABI572_11705 [Actinomycetota bacterium]
MSFQARARMWEAGGRWYARMLDAPAYIEVTGVSRHQCLDELRKVTGDDVTLTVEAIPAVVGVAEAAEIVGWDKRRVITYIDRGSFPEPITSLASGRIWLREDVEAYAADWRARHPEKPSSPRAVPARPTS